MKKYIAPKMDMIDLRAEERLAQSECNGACVRDVTYNGVTYHAGTHS